jgi:hypothetical protein
VKRPDDPPGLLRHRNPTAPLLRAYLRATRAPQPDNDAGSDAAWQRLAAGLDAPTRPPGRWPLVTIRNGLAAACLAVWLLSPAAGSPERGGSDGVGGASGLATAAGGTEGASGAKRQSEVDPFGPDRL